MPELTLTCPICGDTDRVEFVFALHQKANGSTSRENPTDYPVIYMCPMLHVYDENGRSIECPN